MSETIEEAEELASHPLMQGTRYRLVRRHGYSPDMADAMIRGLAQFLFVVVEAPSEVSPPLLIDEAWHDSLIDTRNYALACEKYFGGVVHHNPPLSDEGEHRTDGCLSVAATVDFAASIFGETLERRVWRKK